MQSRPLQQHHGSCVPEEHQYGEVAHIQPTQPTFHLELTIFVLRISPAALDLPPCTICSAFLMNIYQAMELTTILLASHPEQTRFLFPAQKSVSYTSLETVLMTYLLGVQFGPSLGLQPLSTQVTPQLKGHRISPQSQRITKYRM